jgi:hypothetical protein
MYILVRMRLAHLVDPGGFKGVTALMVNGFGDIARVVSHELDLCIDHFPEKLGG